MVPDIALLEQPPITDTDAESVALPRSLQGPHRHCRGFGCAACVHTGLACAAWVVFEREQERCRAEQFGEALAFELAGLFDDCRTDLVRLTNAGRSNSAVVARVTKMLDDHCWAQHGTVRADTGAAA